MRWANELLRSKAPRFRAGSFFHRMTPRLTSQTQVVPAREPPVDLTRLDRILEEFKSVRGALIPILQRAQDAYGFLPREVLSHIACKARVPLADVFGVATFYAQFHLERRGRHLIRVCDGTACHVRGANRNIEVLEKNLGLVPGGTSPDYEYTVEVVYCLGSCGLAPVAVVDNQVCGRLTPEGMVRHLRMLAPPKTETARQI
jgi:NADH:ubiquinone oxidoreductase subunit E